MTESGPVSGEHRATAPMEKAIYRALADAPGLSPIDVGSVEMMMQGGEWELAFEVMCTQIDEHDVPVTEVGVQYIERLGRELGVDARCMSWIREGLRKRTGLENALLDLGMEDLIALPETLHAPETSGLLHRSGHADDVARALASLLESHRIEVWSARWQDEPEPIDHAAALKLLQDTSRYDFGSPADRERRVYYVNVDNLRVEPDGDVRTRDVHVPGPTGNLGDAP